MSLARAASRSQAPGTSPDPSPTTSTSVPARSCPDPIDKIILAQSVNLLAGAPGVGKTALIAWLLTRFRDSLPIFGYTPVAIPKIAFIGADRSWDNSTRFWFEAAAYADIPHYSLQDDRDFNPQQLRSKSQRIAILERCLDAVGDLPVGSLIVIDPLALFLGGNLIDYDSCMVACSQIRRICQDRGITIIGTAHSAKQKADKKERYKRLQDNILGSTALFGYTDTQMYLAAPEETGADHYTFLWAPHHKPPELFPLGRDASGLFVPWADSTAALQESSILKLIPLEAPGIGFGELVVASEGASRATVHRVLTHFLNQGVIEKVAHGRYCRRAAH